MTRMTLLAGSAAMVMGLGVGALLAQPQPQGPQPFFVGNRAWSARRSGRRWRVQRDVVERQGLWRHLLGGELLVRPRPRPHRRAEPGRRRRTSRPTTPGSRSSTTTARSTPRDGSAYRIPASRAVPEAAARAERAVRQRHRQGRAVSGGPRRRHGPQRSECRGHSAVHDGDGRAGGRDPRREIAVVQRYRGRGRRDHLRDADGRRRRRLPTRRPGRSGRSRPTASPPSSFRARRCVSPTGSRSTRKGNIVVANMGTDEILTFSTDGKLLKTESAAQAGSDGLVIMPDGTKYVSSVRTAASRASARASRPSSSPRTSRAPRRCATTRARSSW